MKKIIIQLNKVHKSSYSIRFKPNLFSNFDKLSNAENATNILDLIFKGTAKLL